MGGPRTPTGDPANSGGHRCVTSICHAPRRGEGRPELSPSRRERPAARPRSRAEQGAAGAAGESGHPRRGSIAGQRRQRAPGASPGFGRARTLNRVIYGTSLCIKARLLLLPPTPERCSESLSERPRLAKAYE